MTYIASHIDNNVRELEGALTKVVAYASFKHYPVTSELAKEVLKNTIAPAETKSEENNKTISINLIQETVAKYFKLTLAELNGKNVIEISHFLDKLLCIFLENSLMPPCLELVEILVVEITPL